MADFDYEELHKTFEKLPSNLKTSSPFYSLVPNLDEDTTPSPKSDSEQDDDTIQLKKSDDNQGPINYSQPPIKSVSLDTTRSPDDDELGDGLKSRPTVTGNGGILERGNTYPFATTPTGQVERRRRKLPEIPKHKKSSILLQGGGSGQTNLAEELGMSPIINNFSSLNQTQLNSRSILALKCSYIMDEDSSPDSDRLHSLGDVDSGHSTAHSPNDLKSMSPQTQRSPASPFPPALGGVPFSRLEMLEATHRGLHKFIPRHQDEIEIEIGDPVYVQKEADDFWCEGVNIRTGRQGIFPSAYAVDLEYNDFDPTAVQVKKERYLLGYLGSVETLAHKGTGVVCSAVRKIVGEFGDSPSGTTCILEVSDQGLRMVDRSPQSKEKKKPCIDYFYSLKNVSFCAFHPRDHRYIGFITKHPTVQRFACHVFKGHESTRPVAEAVGRAFQRFYQKFIETAYPIEDIYIE